jgi:hypothetical protein
MTTNRTGERDQISERVIEDILSFDRSVLAELLGLNVNDLSLVSRQKRLASGNLDLLYLCGDQLLLIELKAVPFYYDVIGQIQGYFEDLCELQSQRKLIDAPISRIILVTGAAPADFERCKREGIQLSTYDPQLVLSRYYQDFRELSPFLKIQSSDYGMWRLSLLTTTLRLLSQGRPLQDICGIEARSKNTIRNRLSVAARLALVTKHKGEFFLTDLGNEFLNACADGLPDRLSEQQIDTLSTYVMGNPFYSSVTYTILALVEAIFVLARNSYPVPTVLAQDYFVKSVGKVATWKTKRAQETAFNIFSNYACELEFLANVDQHLYLAPRGIRAILLLQLNRSIRLIESQNPQA